MKKQLAVFILISNFAAYHQAWGAVPSRPNATITGSSVQKSALPTAASKTKSEIGGATSANQKSIGTLGGPNSSYTPNAQNAPKITPPLK